MSSILLDFYKYWKDEKSEDAEDSKGSQIPITPNGYASYLMYNALDCHNTLGVFRMLCHLAVQLKWPTANYAMEFGLQSGPLQAMAMRGIRLNSEIQAQIYWENVSKSDAAMCNLRTMVDQPDFNPNSPQQVETLIYDILQATELPRKGRSTDETILKMIQLQSPLLQLIIQQIWDTKKPANNASKYGISSNIQLNGRLMYGLHAGTTPTQRLASKSHNLWCGTNIQNVPKYMRSMLEADPGYLLVDIDYSQSDAYFTAFESGDTNFIRTMQGENGSDTHCYHGSYFFGVDYAKLLASHNAHEDWADHPTTGIRQITKRIVYGANYFMVGYTLYIQMGHKAVVAAAKLLGHADADYWQVKQCADFCDQLLVSYFTMYPEVESSILAKAQAATRRGNKATTAWGYTRLFFADLVNDKAALREFAAFFGQGGTAGNVNLALKKLFYQMESLGVELLAQVHDSIICQIPETKLELIPQIQTTMENTCTIGKHTFTVPTEAAVGRGWGKRLVEYRPDLTLADIDRHDASWMATNLCRSKTNFCNAI
jgi:DNA polymerase-1